METDTTKADDGHPTKIRSHVPWINLMKMFVQKGSHVIEQVVDNEEKVSAKPVSEELASEYLRFNDLDFIKWRKEQKELAAVTTNEIKPSTSSNKSKKKTNPKEATTSSSTS